MLPKIVSTYIDAHSCDPVLLFFSNLAVEARFQTVYFLTMVSVNGYANNPT